MSKLEAVYLGELECELKHPASGAVVRTDAPPQFGGADKSFSATDLMASSVGLCMMTILGVAAQKKNVCLKGTKIDIEKVMTTSLPRKIGEIRLRFAFPPVQLSDAEKREIEAFALSSCAAEKSLHPDVQKNIVFVW